MKKNKFISLPTIDTEDNNLIPLSEYPRMQFRRDSFFNLNGLWDLEISKNKNKVSSFSESIMVPYPIESLLSLKERRLSKKAFLHYHKTFSFEKDFLNDITYLHFGAVDQKCDVYLNDSYLGHHDGGYLPFTFEITKVVKENDNSLYVIVSDEQNTQKEYAYGKQRIKRGGIWYTEVTGIWQTVWIESVNKCHFNDIRITPNIDDSSIFFELATTNISNGNVIINLNNEDTLKYHFSTPSFKITLPNVILWSPENPFLYNFTLESDDDKVFSYFAMRKFSVGVNNNIPCLMLNNKPYFFNGVLDQGYYSDGIYTPKSYQVMENEITLMKEMGFNTLRKHIKIESLYWYYLCDKLGMVVWQDMVNSGDYNFLKDTASPTIGFKNKTDATKPFNKTFEKEMRGTIKHLYNVASIGLWTIFNEGWGQHQSKYYCDILKGLDQTRIIDHASGWFDQGISDVNSKHIYFKKIKINPKFKKDPRPIILSEFGGYAYKVEGHIFNPKKSFGYKLYKVQKEFEDDLINLYENEIIPLIPLGLSAAIYTQLSDVEDETNGLITYDRMVVKVDVKRIRETLDKCKYTN